MVSRVSGRAIATSSWLDADAMAAQRERLAPMRARGSEILGGAAEVSEWEVAVMHRHHDAHERCCCRINWARAEDVDFATGVWRAGVPGLENFDGFCSASLLVDRERSLMCGTFDFDSRDALEATREAFAGTREQARDVMRIEIFDHAELDLAIAHLRVPELV